MWPETEDKKKLKGTPAKSITRRGRELKLHNGQQNPCNPFSV